MSEIIVTPVFGNDIIRPYARTKRGIKPRVGLEVDSIDHDKNYVLSFQILNLYGKDLDRHIPLMLNTAPGTDIKINYPVNVNIDYTARYILFHLYTDNVYDHLYLIDEMVA